MAGAAWFFPRPRREPERLQSLFAKARERIGFVPNVFRGYSYRPERFSADLARLESLGLSKDEVWDVIEVAAMYNFTNRMALATGQLPNREFHHLDRPAG